MTEPLVLEHVDGTRIHIHPRRLVVAGFTGSDPVAVRQHIDELAAAGVPRPDSVPAFYELDPSLVTAAREISVDGDRTSGELEPVIVFTESGPVLTVGSDHTDRELERSDIPASKAACPKVVGHLGISLAHATEAWSEAQLTSWVADTLYQDAPLSMITSPPALVQEGEGVIGAFEAGTVLFLGTVPLVREFDFSPDFVGRLTLPGTPALTVAYRSLSRKEQPR